MIALGFLDGMLGISNIYNSLYLGSHGLERIFWL